jgi:hypothetical protein
VTVCLLDTTGMLIQHPILIPPPFPPHPPGGHIPPQQVSVTQGPQASFTPGIDGPSLYDGSIVVAPR